MGNKYYQLMDKIENWAKERGIDTSDPKAQMTKVIEEVSELNSALHKDDKEGIIDGIGDVQVTLIILSMQLGLNYENCLEHAYNEIKNRTGKKVDGIFVKDEQK